MADMIEWHGIRRDSAFEPGATALLLVDMQRLWVDPTLDHGKPPGIAAFYYRRLATEVVPNQIRLLDAARSAGAEIVHTVIRSSTSDGRDRSLDHKLSDIHIRPDDPQGDVIDELRPLPDEIVLPKTSSGVFNSTNLNYLLRNLGVRFLIVAGIVTDQCVDMAVRDGADLGYLVTCVSDACATYTQERHDAALRAFGGYCWTADTATVVDRLRRMAPPRAIA
jgi:biuret amidohydrolase